MSRSFNTINTAVQWKSTENGGKSDQFSEKEGEKENFKEREEKSRERERESAYWCGTRWFVITDKATEMASQSV
jgi:hypothetical protein